METHSSILAWKISWTEETGGLQSMGQHRGGHDWATEHTSGKKEIIKLIAEISETENKISRKKINETKSLFFKQMNKIDKLPGRLTKKKKGRMQISNIRNERENQHKIPWTLKRIIKYCELYAHNFHNLDKMT